MVQQREGMPSRRSRIVWSLAVFGVAIPVVVLAGLYLASTMIGVAFGDVVFGLTILVVVVWVVVAGWGRRMDAARPSGELFRNAASDYGSEVSRGRFARFASPARLLVTLTGTVILGWVVVIATL